MASQEKIKAIKELHPDYVLLVKEGEFYHSYGKDAYIVSYLLGYKLKKVNDTKICGFPTISMNKVLSKLESKKINYILVDKRNNYEVEDQENFKNLNNYNKAFYKAKEHINRRIRVENINEYILKIVDEDNFKNIINQVEKIIDENRKI